ncbi:MAG: caspase family protein [Xanthobacteraceae bacterium]
MVKSAIYSQWRFLRVPLFERAIVWPLTALCLLLSLQPDPAAAETRRAFLVGIQRYSDGYIQQLTRTANDARDLGKELEDVGFDKKNIKVVVDSANKADFQRDFSAFLKTVEPGDDVVFFFSGHGFGVEADQTNYLLLGDLKSPFTYTKNQLSDDDRKNPDIVRLKIPQYLDAYQQNEIPNGISAYDIQRQIAEKNPKTVIMILDACRSLVQSEGTESEETKLIKRGAESGSRLLSVRKPPPGFLILYSASFGEQAIESLGVDGGRNSLFTGILRSELERPGQSAVELGERVKLMVRSIAARGGKQQEPEVFYDKGHAASVDDFYFVGSIGRERFQITQDKCAGEVADWNEIKTLQKRELYDRHIRRFDLCPHGTAEAARRAGAALALSSDDPIEVTAVASPSVNECDRLAASPLDGARPPEVPGVLTAKLDPDAAIPACDKATKDNPRVARYLYNLGRAYYRLALQPDRDKNERDRALDSARFAYDDAAKRGYISALNDLAGLEEFAGNSEKAIDLYKRAAEQGHPLARYNLAIHYRDGDLVPRDFVQAAEWFAKSAEGGLVSAMVEYGYALTHGLGTNLNPRRGIEWLQQAAEAGSLRAKFYLGSTYYYGVYCGQTPAPCAPIPIDRDLALLWYSRVAEAGDSIAEARVAQIMEGGQGLPNPQPEIAERYWRLAAHGGNAYAQVEFAERLRRGFLLIKQEYGENEVISLFEHAMSQGSAQAAVALAQVYRNGELGVQKDPIRAMKLAYHAIDLAIQTDPMSEEANPYYEINAAHLLVGMAMNGEAVDAAGRPLLTPDEIDRLQHFYGTVDPATKEVSIRRLNVPMLCALYINTKTRQLFFGPPTRHFLIWVWDWGRSEAPTDLQIRDIERREDCHNQDLRATLEDVYAQAKKSKVAFADLLYQKIETLQGQIQPQEHEGDRSGGRRRR